MPKTPCTPHATLERWDFTKVQIIWHRHGVHTMSSFDCRVVELLCFVNVFTLFVHLIGRTQFLSSQRASLLQEKQNDKQKIKSGSLKLCQNCFAPCLQSDHCMVYTAPCGGGGGWPDRYSLCNMALFFLQVCLAEKFYGLHCYNASLSEHCGTLLVCLIANGLWNCLLLSKCLRTHDLTHTKNTE